MGTFNLAFGHATQMPRLAPLVGSACAREPYLHNVSESARGARRALERLARLSTGLVGIAQRLSRDPTPDQPLAQPGHGV